MPRKRKRKSKMTITISGGRRGRKSKLASASFADLQNELHRRQEQVQTLLTARERLSAELQELEQLIESVGGSDIGLGVVAPMRRRGPGRPPGSGKGRKAMSVAAPRHGRRGPRTRNAANLADSLASVLKGKTMGVSEVATAVQRAGYKTTSPNFRTIVNQALLANPSMFKKVSRGQYTAK
jgi:hypothetical protein